jgi:hypothetical protein
VEVHAIIAWDLRRHTECNKVLHHSLQSTLGIRDRLLPAQADLRACSGNVCFMNSGASSALALRSGVEATIKVKAKLATAPHGILLICSSVCACITGPGHSLASASTAIRY